jgi:hypothetical protein
VCGLALLSGDPVGGFPGFALTACRCYKRRYICGQLHRYSAPTAGFSGKCPPYPLYALLF